MREIKDSKQATVRIGYDGRVYKRYNGRMAKERFENEVRILRYLEEKDCGFVPRLLEADEAELSIVTTNCGQMVKNISQTKLKRILDELETFGVRHGDAFERNVTYNSWLGRFCLIDFELATILETGVGLTLEDLQGPGRSKGVL